MPTFSKVDRARGREKPYKLFDERDLYLLVKPDNSRLRRFKYRLGGKKKSILLGKYPDVGLLDAHEAWDDCRTQLAVHKVEPSAKKRAEITARFLASEGTINAVSEECLIHLV